MWPSVRRGEFKWIYSTQEDADFVFNSLLFYEHCVMKKYAMDLLNTLNTLLTWMIDGFHVIHYYRNLSAIPVMLKQNKKRI